MPDIELKSDLTMPVVPDVTLKRHKTHVTAIVICCACIALRADLIQSQTESADVTDSLNIPLKELQTFMYCCRDISIFPIRDCAAHLSDIRYQDSANRDCL
jgi:hypothetical protein